MQPDVHTSTPHFKFNQVQKEEHRLIELVNMHEEDISGRPEPISYGCTTAHSYVYNARERNQIRI